VVSSVLASARSLSVWKVATAPETLRPEASKSTPEIVREDVLCSLKITWSASLCSRLMPLKVASEAS